ncbi:homoserine O-acetyltransferase [Evansella vedderi]|uniref:Homoserine O-acetyltransferase n=1 Tax=Evansella vedderi TaxID=38282 RepID=A0ABT9ZVY4_9BACI|nr:homoserine O-acetyltransferase [Evansella vedderi]MDQ0254633.1 homoserine O-acetyltransferase [Evansella vedderi]
MVVKQLNQVKTGTVTLPVFTLESGIQLKDVTLAYEWAGPEVGDPILVCHALTGNQHTVGTEEEPGWWRGLINYSGYVDLYEQPVITFNVLGGCNGSTGPLSINPASDQPYRTELPFISVRDMVKAQKEALNILGIQKLKGVIGGSLGGMQALEWAVTFPEMVEKLIVMAATSSLSDYGMSYNAIARKAIMDDPNWNEGNYTDHSFPTSGLSLARMIGMITYRSDQLFNQRFHREKKDEWGTKHKEVAYQVESYLLYQGDKFTKRFDPNSYLYLLKAMDNHDIEAGRNTLEKTLSSFQKEVYLISYKGDLLYPPADMERLAEAWEIAGAQVNYKEVDTIFGHDGFLTEFDKWGAFVHEALKEKRPVN